MLWENLSGPAFESGVARAEGVCIIPVGVLEYHGAHLPLGTDMLYSHAVACGAADREPAIVYPAYHFGVNTETKHYPGGIVIKDELLLRRTGGCRCGLGNGSRFHGRIPISFVDCR